MKDISYPEIDSTLVKKLNSIFVGNNAKSDDFTFEAPIPLAFNIIIKNTWSFKGECTPELFVSNSKEVGSIADMRAYTKELASQTRSSKVRNTFKNMIESKPNSIGDADYNLKVVDFGNFTGTDRCNSCAGSGKKKCTSCFGSGKERCSSCNGSGRIEQLTVDKRIISKCGKCSGSGKVSCYRCHGSKKIDCSVCNGRGIYSQTVNVSIYASAKKQFELNHIFKLEGTTDDKKQFYNKVYATLNKYFESSSAIRLDELINFELVEREYQLDSEAYTYVGSSPGIIKYFSLKNKKYVCASFSEKIEFFLTPPVFDDLFKKEINKLKVLNQKKHISRFNAKKLFKQYKNTPALDKALTFIASAGADEGKQTTNIIQIVKAFSGFISYEAAQNFALAVPKLVKRISPVFSTAIWFLVGLFVNLVILVASEVLITEIKDNFSIFSIVFYIFFIFIFVYLANKSASILSYIVTFIRRLFISKKYRLKIDSSKPRWIFIKVTFGLIALYLVYGVLVYKSIIPYLNVNGFIENKIVKVINFTCETIGKPSESFKICLKAKKHQKKQNNKKKK